MECYDFAISEDGSGVCLLVGDMVCRTGCFGPLKSYALDLSVNLSLCRVTGSGEEQDTADSVSEEYGIPPPPAQPATEQVDFTEGVTEIFFDIQAKNSKC